MRRLLRHFWGSIDNRGAGHDGNEDQGNQNLMHCLCSSKEYRYTNSSAIARDAEHSRSVVVRRRGETLYECQVLSLEWHNCSRLQRLHLGLRAMQTWRPWWITWWEKSIHFSLGRTRISSSSTFWGVSPFARLSRRAMRNTWVSTTTPSARQ